MVVTTEGKPSSAHPVPPRPVLPRPDLWQHALPRVLGLALVLIGLPFADGLVWSATTWVLVVLMSGAWALWSAAGFRTGSPVSEALAVPVLGVAMISGNVLITLEPKAMLATAIVGMAAVSSGVFLSTLVSAAVLAAGILALAIGGIVAGLPGQAWASVAAWIAALLACQLAGATRRNIGTQHAQAEELLLQTRRVHEEEQRAAALAERTRVAREIHDVLAQSLGALAVQLDVTDSLLTADSPRTEEAVERVRNARRIAVDGLTETRRAIAALRADTPPLPEALTALVHDHRTASGAPATFTPVGTPRALEPDVGLALLRVAQESLANAAKHARGQELTATLDYEEDQVRLTVLSGPVSSEPTGSEPAGSGPVSSEPAGSGPVSSGPASAEPADSASGEAGPRPRVAGMDGGYGLAGMRERLLLVGGDLAVGPTPEGWRVQAEVPA
ncbi:histidine kinase [Streptomyces sp. NPDC050610]|uniref:sensor histidine kinase n=1 Tax=Streptomyces sp. NPDC050610 TaxID=3157097 RepID=UPI003418E797